MKKITLISLLSTLSCSPFVYADCMGGGCAASALNGGAAFFAVEGGYVKTTSDGFNYIVTNPSGTITSSEDTKPYAFRLSAGMMTAIDDQFAVSGELGWGYYGQSNLTPVYSPGFTAFIPGTPAVKYTFGGFDALVGAIYTLPSFNLYLKAGALIESTKTETNANPTSFDVFTGFNSTSTTTSVLPEIKIGGTYNFNENFGMTLSYMYAVGGKPGLTGTLDAGTGVGGLTINSESPSISALMVGFQATV